MPNYITTHNADGKAVFSGKIPTESHKVPIPIGEIQIIASTHSFPTNLSTEADIDQYQQDRTQQFFEGSRRICPENGTATCIMNMKPGAGVESLFHRTMTLDVIVMIEGAVEIQLDSGEKRVLEAGDTIVQRATMHSWRNVTPNDGWAKWVGFIQTVKVPLKIGDYEFGPEWIHQ